MRGEGSRGAAVPGQVPASPGGSSTVSAGPQRRPARRPFCGVRRPPRQEGRRGGKRVRVRVRRGLCSLPASRQRRGGQAVPRSRCHRTGTLRCRRVPPAATAGSGRRRHYSSAPACTRPPLPPWPIGSRAAASAAFDWAKGVSIRRLEAPPTLRAVGTEAGAVAFLRNSKESRQFGAEKGIFRL